MTAPVEQTLNVTVAQVEDALLAGQTVPDFAREWSEPPGNVLAIFRRLQNEGRIPRNAPAQVASKPPAAGAPVAGGRSLTSVPTLTAASSAPPSLDALVSTAARSTSKRTQALGVKLHDLAGVVRARLTEEREAAEQAEKVKAERDQAAADVARLEAQLAAAKAKLRPARQGGGPSVRRRSSGRGISDEQRAKMLAGQRNTTPCAKGCGYVAKTKSGKSAHERTCGGAS